MKSYNRIIVVGRKTSGKTFYVKYGIVPYLKRYIIYDPDKHFTRLGKLVHTIDQFKQIMRKQHKIIFQPYDRVVMDFDECKKEFNELGKLVNLLKHTTFIIDEIAMVTLKEGSKVAHCPPSLRLMIRRREKLPHRIGVICTAQHLKDSDVEFSSQADYLIAFDCYPVDIAYIKDKLGIDITELMGRLDTERHEFIFYNHAKKKLYISRLNKRRTR